MSLISDNEALLSDLQSWRGESLESINPSALSRKLSVILASAGKTLTFVGNDLPKQAKLLFRSNYDTDAALRKVDFASAYKINVPILTGQKTTFDGVVNCLIEDVAFLKGSIEYCLVPAERVLNRLFGQPSELNGEFNFEEFDQLKARYKTLVELRTRLGDCFDKKKQATYGDYGAVFESNGQVKVVEDKIRELSKEIAKIDLDKVRKKIKDVDGAAMDLHKLITGKAEFLPSSFIASKVTEMLFSIAEEVEFLAAVLTFHSALFNTFQEVQGTLAKLK